MSIEQAERLIDIYRNTLSADSLCETVSRNLNAGYVSCAWYVGNNLWYIPHIWKKKELKTQGWYIEKTPSEFSMPEKSPEGTVFYNFGKDQSKYFIYHSISDTKVSPVYRFACEAFIEKLFAEDFLIRQDRRKELLLANICHNIRTPLSGIINMTNMLTATDRMYSRAKGKPHVDDSKIFELNQDNLKCLNKSAMQLATNIYDIVDITRLDIGKLRLNKTVCNLREIIEGVMRIASAMDKNKKVTIQHHIDKSLPEYAYTDKKRVKQILINLLDNAIRFTKKGEINLMVSSIIVFPEQEEDKKSATDLINHQITFTVQDTGQGISDAIKATLFKPPEMLKQIHEYGISLRVSYLLAQCLGGNLMLKYSEVGKGSVFDFSLLVCEEEPPRYDSNTLKALKEKTVLLLDDSDDRVLLAKNIEQCGMKYSIASSYGEVRILHLDKKYDIVMCQLQLRNEKGSTVCSRLRDIWPKTKFIAITDNPEEASKKIFHETIIPPIDEYHLKTVLLGLITKKNKKPKPYVLAVDDERINRIVIEKQLRRRGYSHVDVAANGEEALRILKANPGYYNILLTDIRMPNMNGFQLAKKVKALSESPRIVGVVAHTLLEDEQTEDIIEFVSKPIDIDELDNVLDN